MALYTQRSNCKLMWDFDYSSWSYFQSNPITSATPAASPSGLTFGTATVSTNGLVVSVAITTPTVSVVTTYIVTILPQTALGFGEPFTFSLKVIP